MDALGDGVTDLEKVTAEVKAVEGMLKKAEAYRDLVVPAMKALRKTADELETIVDTEVWPLLTYARMLFVL